MKNIKLTVSNPMKYNKNADTLLFLLLFSTSQSKKNIEKTFVNAGKGEKKQRDLGVLYHNIYRNLAVKITFT